MNVAILHFHFNRGGVTPVVLNQLRSLDAVVDADEGLRITLIHGGRREGIPDEQLSGFGSIDLSIHTIKSLDYDHGSQVHDDQLAHEIRAILDRMGFHANETLLHIHNHALGKNISLPGAIRRLALDGFGVLLQLHDFAEDLRPTNYERLSQSLGFGGNPSSEIYPQASRMHYAVLNSRDHGVLQQAGVDDERLHRLPNAVGDLGVPANRASAREKLRDRFNIDRETKYVLYPVRAIRRKNLGEVLLWSAMGFGNSVFGVTLPPLNPAERSAYQHWTSLAKDLDLACVFETGAPGGLEFKENLAAADLLFTTSIAEGFGMVFLESWLSELNLVGRDLPEITSDFVESGIRFDDLYAQLPIPIDWIGRRQLHGTLTAAYGQLLQSYGLASDSRDTIDDQVSTLLQSNHIDFAALTTQQQTEVIRRVREDAAAREQVVELTPHVQRAVEGDLTDQPIQQNSDVVRQFYSLEASGERLQWLYRTVMSSPPSEELEELAQAGRILNAYLDISRLHPIRFETP